MTSELKHRDIWEVANQLVGYVGPDTEARLANFLLREGKEAAKLAERIVALENTRAAPDVPELVRYDLDKRGVPWIEMEQRDDGDYVRYDQAAKVVAKLTKDANHQCRERVKEFERAEAAEAKYTELESAWLNAEGKITELEAELKRYKEGEQCTN